jgi:alpha-mannosidase
MHDEANPSFVDMIDQTALGHRLISEAFGTGALPRVCNSFHSPSKYVITCQIVYCFMQATWQIDPFGHSGFQASMMSSPLAGFNCESRSRSFAVYIHLSLSPCRRCGAAVFFARADYQDFASRTPTKATEFFWYPSVSQSTNAATLGKSSI